MDDQTALYALIGVIAAALITALGGVTVAYLGKKNATPPDPGDRRRPADQAASEIQFLTKTYQDARADLDACREEKEELERQVQSMKAEVIEARMLVEHFMREVALLRDGKK